MRSKTRRSFIKKSASAVIGASVFSSMPYKIYGSVGANETINIGVIGLGFGIVNMRKMLEGTPWVRCHALCDVNEIRLNTHAAALKKDFPQQASEIIQYKDFRQILENKDIDGVIIATPDHWHTYIYAEACKAGKAIYIEKPTGHSIQDCNLMVDLQSKYQNVVTTGLWHISLEYFIEAFAILKSGILGDVYKVHAWITKNEKPVQYTLPQVVPDTLNYEMWQGHAKAHEYAEERLSNWRFFWNYGGGRQTDWLHYLDSAFDGLMALGYERKYPQSVYSSGYQIPKTMLETPAGQTSIFQFDNYQIVWEHQVADMYGRGDGVAWIGSNATLVCSRTGYELIPEKSSGIEPIKIQGSYGNQFNHMINWANCIKTQNQKTNSPIDKGSFVSSVANIANISYRLGGQSLEYLDHLNKFKNNPIADELLSSKYTNGWVYPTL